MPRIRPSFVTLSWVLAGILGSAVLVATPRHVMAETQSSVSSDARGTTAIVVGFMGGFVSSHDLRREEVRVAQQLRARYGNSVHVEVFENRAKAKAHKLILQWLENDKNEKIAGEDGHETPIILFGHSWGASTALSLARDLQREGIPVMLTVQVDSISKAGADDSLIPANVAEAINFYQNRGILHGCPKIRAADPTHTNILGNFWLRYKKRPVEYRQYPWYNRLLFKGHIAIECDPRLWSQIESLIRMHLPPNGTGADQGRSSEKAPG
jgi:pimeloyl-ACP methyl ester carboxylesterase